MPIRRILKRNVFILHLESYFNVEIEYGDYPMIDELNLICVSLKYKFIGTEGAIYQVA